MGTEPKEKGIISLSCLLGTIGTVACDYLVPDVPDVPETRQKDTIPLSFIKCQAEYGFPTFLSGIRLAIRARTITICFHDFHSEILKPQFFKFAVR